LAVCEIEYGENLLARDWGIKFDKRVDRFAAFEEVDQTLDRDARATEAGRPTHAKGTSPDGFAETAFLFGGHNVLR